MTQAKPVGLPTNVVRPADTKKYIPEDYKKVAGGMEQQFLQYLVEKMKNTVEKNGEESSAMNYYQGLQNEEYSKLLSKSQTKGIQDLILDQIYPKRFRSQIALNAYENNKKSRIKRLQNIEMQGPEPSPFDRIKKAQNSGPVVNKGEKDSL